MEELESGGNMSKCILWNPQRTNKMRKMLYYLHFAEVSMCQRLSVFILNKQEFSSELFLVLGYFATIQPDSGSRPSLQFSPMKTNYVKTNYAKAPEVQSFSCVGRLWVALAAIKSVLYAFLILKQ